MTTEKFLPFHKPSITEAHIQAVADAMRSGWLTSAGQTLKFEEAFARRVGARHAVAVNSCTAALHLAMIAMDVRPGDEVITSPITFASAVNMIEHLGAKPVFVDVCPEDLTLDPVKASKAITEKTKLIVATHFAGWPADMRSFDFIEKVRGVKVLTDAAHGIEVEYRGRKSGALGSAACYSFYATKNITTGEGGMLATDYDDIADRVRTLRLHGMTKGAWDRYGPSGYKHWDIVEPGWKYNLSDIQASLGLAQLEDMDDWLKKREDLERAYIEKLDGSVSTLYRDDIGVKRAHHLFVIQIPKRDEIMREMQERGVGVGVHFRAVHRLKYYQEKYQIPEGALPISEYASDHVLSLPLYPSMEISDVDRVVRVLKDSIRAAHL